MLHKCSQLVDIYMNTVVPLKHIMQLVKCTLKHFDDLLAVDKIDPEKLAEPDDMRNFLKPVTELAVECLADKQLAEHDKGEQTNIEQTTLCRHNSATGEARLLHRGPNCKIGTPRLDQHTGMFTTQVMSTYDPQDGKMKKKTP